MDYALHYGLLISRARGRTFTGYTESHHIIPRCVGGNNEPWNMVELTGEEHYVAHQLLVKMYPNTPRLATAAMFMSRQCTGNKSYGWLRRRHASAMSAFHMGKPKSPEAIAKTAAALRGRKKSPEAVENSAKAQRGKILSAEHRAKLSAAGRGRLISPEHRAKLSSAMKGKKFSPEHLANMASSRLGKKRGPHSAETKAKISSALMGNTINLGRVMTPQHKANLSAARRAMFQALR